MKTKERVIKYKEFEKQCYEIAKCIMENKNIKNIFGIHRGGTIPATRISYLTGLPITMNPKSNETAIIDDCIDSGNTRHSFSNFKYFFVLIDKQFEREGRWLVFPWEKDENKFWRGK